LCRQYFNLKAFARAVKIPNMKKLLCLFLFLSFSLTSPAQIKVIFDTDMDSDVDDVEALAMLHHLADQKKIEILGIIVTSDDPYAPLCVSALNQFFGRPRIPIGFLQKQPQLKNHSKYTRQIAEEFPHRLKSHEQAEEAGTLYRRLLQKSPDSSVTVITVGHLTSWQNLLASPPDKYSALSGTALAHKKIAKWLCMGGQFPAGKEANFYRPDPASTVYSINAWQKSVIFCGWEAGNQVITGGSYLKNQLSPKSPVYRAYELYNNFKGRPSWDQLAVFLLTPEATTYFDTVTQGTCQVNPDGSNTWNPNQESKHEYLIFKPGDNLEKLARFIDDMAQK
jgi:inosine-uridine nucleoside N-ribohydrolase